MPRLRWSGVDIPELPPGDVPSLQRLGMDCERRAGMSRYPNPIWTDRAEEIHRLWHAGATVSVIARTIDMPFSSTRDALRRLGYKRRSGWHRVEKWTGPSHHIPIRQLMADEYMSPAARADAERLLRQVPRDTRDLTARFCGDPLPGRSALEQQS